MFGLLRRFRQRNKDPEHGVEHARVSDVVAADVAPDLLRVKPVGHEHLGSRQPGYEAYVAQRRLMVDRRDHVTDIGRAHLIVPRNLEPVVEQAARSWRRPPSAPTLCPK